MADVAPDPHDDVPIPVSAGIPAGVSWLLLVGVLVIFAMLGLVVFDSTFGHHWPWDESLKIEVK